MVPISNLKNLMHPLVPYFSKFHCNISLPSGTRISHFASSIQVYQLKCCTIQEEIKSRLKSGNAGYHTVQNIFSSSLLPQNLMIKICRTIILPVVLYGCETWSLTLREERRLRMFENRVLRRIFWPQRDEARMAWRKLRNEELNDLYSSPNIVRVIKSRRIRWAGHVARMGGRGEV